MRTLGVELRRHLDRVLVGDAGAPHFAIVGLGMHDEVRPVVVGELHRGVRQDARVALELVDQADVDARRSSRTATRCGGCRRSRRCTPADGSRIWTGSHTTVRRWSPCTSHVNGRCGQTSILPASAERSSVRRSCSMYAMTSRSGANSETSAHVCPGTVSYSPSCTTSPSVTTALSVASLQRQEYATVACTRCLTPVVPRSSGQVRPRQRCTNTGVRHLVLISICRTGRRLLRRSWPRTCSGRRWSGGRRRRR